MARDVDRIIEYVRSVDYIPPVLKQVLVNRIDPPPTRDELDRAHEQVYPNVRNNDPWKDGTVTEPAGPRG